MKTGSQAARSARKRKEPIGELDRGEKRTERTPPRGAALFLIGFKLSDVKRPVVELEFGIDGPIDPAYLPDLRRWFREEWRGLDDQIAERLGCVLLEGYGRYSERGFPSRDTGAMRTGIHRALHELLVEKRETADPILASESDAEIRVSRGSPDLLDRYVTLWKGGAADSSSGMWDQLVVPSSRPEEESVMKRIPATSQDTGGLSLRTVLSRLNEMDEQVTRAHSPIRTALQTELDGLAGSSFGSVEANTQFADTLRFLMIRLGVRVACPREGCGEPSLIRCRPGARTVQGSFEFEHTRNGKLSTHSAATRLPALKLVDAPVHRRRKPRR